jgi:hypothetical protein
MDSDSTSKHWSQRECPVASPPVGRKTLPGHWWTSDFADGTLLLYREECRVRRERAAPRRKKRTWDEARQADRRTLAHYQWTFCQDELWTPSTARH